MGPSSSHLPGLDSGSARPVLTTAASLAILSGISGAMRSEQVRILMMEASQEQKQTNKQNESVW